MSPPQRGRNPAQPANRAPDSETPATDQARAREDACPGDGSSVSHDATDFGGISAAAALAHTPDLTDRATALARGTRNLLADVRDGRRTPRQVDAPSFRLGENIGATPGTVVFRNEVVEIIRYAPVTERVRAIPLLIVWSLVNRFYILDLAPGRSFIEYAVSQGIEVFVTSWRNPGREQARWDLDTYAAALLDAMDVIAALTGTYRIGTMGLARRRGTAPGRRPARIPVPGWRSPPCTRVPGGRTGPGGSGPAAAPPSACQPRAMTRVANHSGQRLAVM